MQTYVPIGETLAIPTVYSAWTVTLSALLPLGCRKAVGAGVDTAPRSEELLARGELLSDHASDRNHRQPPVIKLLGLHLLELRGVGRLEAELSETAAGETSRSVEIWETAGRVPASVG